MKVRGRIIWVAVLTLTALVLTPAPSWAKCSLGLVRHFERRAVLVTNPLPRYPSDQVSIKWFGHAFFRIFSPGGTRILTDPFSFERGYTIPATNPHAVTIGKESTNHSGLEIVGGKPIVIRGLTGGGLDWAKVNRKVGDVRVMSVPIVQGGGGDFDYGPGKGASFLFETAGLCIAHLGDLAAPMNPSQLRRLGKVHVALVVLSDRVSMGPTEAADFIGRLSPNIAIPMHYYDDPETLGVFLKHFRRVRRLKTDRLSVSRRTLPRPTEIIVLRHD
ncbi:MAG: MBL fold metallo-hydrolase [Nitrospinaceae bacterium]|jgi:L-ascorbate metabolism protein UlaG (beta-lactamase superfamily)|nr:MBL fold metallo-hydrolase [Nitrospinaceae bacterium]MBT3432764.1 MBL fold metallo-hydrolase [Nitrospinaceae bacterium]MBT3822817.1 MBL fold metallo-hydrolase [Nitrospinaceae bacterium]MBT4095223.1 MBL fold metallo-hydrolase [Nitrospinaceae bacterium]MBT4429935.1 MBL fold metallo-hydrolase [Nitrospinaceae bacterium]